MKNKTERRLIWEGEYQTQSPVELTLLFHRDFIGGHSDELDPIKVHEEFERKTGIRIDDVCTHFEMSLLNAVKNNIRMTSSMTFIEANSHKKVYNWRKESGSGDEDKMIDVLKKGAGELKDKTLYSLIVTQLMCYSMQNLSRVAVYSDGSVTIESGIDIELAIQQAKEKYNCNPCEDDNVVTHQAFMNGERYYAAAQVVMKVDGENCGIGHIYKESEDENSARNFANKMRNEANGLK
jgi:hypothetical protein